ncbi:MAG: MFS transporter [Candidatus Colwellbacteria bacterium]|nr:MFS transporter [Candidatus Colwellbacteria bacterium]
MPEMRMISRLLRSPFLILLPFWLFISFFKFGGNIQYTLLSPLGDRMFDTWMVGLLIGLASMIQLFLDVPAGMLLDRFGYIRMLRIGVLTFILACLALVIIPGPMGFMATLFIGSFGWLFFGPGINAYLLSSAPKEGADNFMATRDVFDATGVFLSAIMIPFLVLAPPQKIGFTSAALLLVALLFLFASPKDKVSVHEEKKTPHHHFYIRRHAFRNLFRSLDRLNPASWLLIGHGLSASIFYSTIWFVLPLMMIDPSKQIFGISLGIFDLAIVAIGSILGKITLHTKKRTAVTAGLFIFAIMAAFLGSQTGWIFLVIGFIATSGDELSNISLWSWLSRLDKDHASDGAVSGTISLFQDFGWMIGPMAAGFLYEAFGPETTISLASIPIFAIFIISLFISSTEKNNHPHPHPRRLRGR